MRIALVLAKIHARPWSGIIINLAAYALIRQIKRFAGPREICSVIMSGASANSSGGCTAERTEGGPPSEDPCPTSGVASGVTIERFVERITEASFIRAFLLSSSLSLSFSSLGEARASVRIRR